MTINNRLGPVQESPLFNQLQELQKLDDAKKAEQDNIREQVASLGPEMKNVFNDLVGGNANFEDFQKIIEENGSESFDKIQDLALQMRATYTKDYSQVATELPQLEVASMPKDQSTDKNTSLNEVASMPKDQSEDKNINLNNFANTMQGQSNDLQKSIDTLSMQIGQLIGQLEGPTTLAGNQPSENSMEKQLVSLNNNVMTLIGINTQTMSLYKKTLDEARTTSAFG